MKTALRKMGNSQGVLIPKPLLAEVGLQTDDIVDLKVKKGRIVITPAGRVARAGWAEDGKALRVAGEAALQWPSPFVPRTDARTGE